jgi:hypothetical protein
MNEMHIIIPDNVYVAVVLSASVVIIMIRIIRWVLDIIP